MDVRFLENLNFFKTPLNPIKVIKFYEMYSCTYIRIHEYVNDGQYFVNIYGLIEHKTFKIKQTDFFYKWDIEAFKIWSKSKKEKE